MAKNSYRSQVTSILLRSESTLIFATLILMIYFYNMQPLFMSTSNLQNIARWVGTYGFMALGEMFVLIGGGIDLSVGSIVAFTGLLMAYLLSTYNLPWVLALLIVILVAAGIGVFHGFFVSKFSPPLPQIVPAFLVTLGSAMAFRGIAQYWTKGYPIVLSREKFADFFLIGEGNLGIVPIPIIIVLVILGIAFLILNLSIIGRHIYAVGGNLLAAIVTGVKVNRIRVLCYVLSTIFSALTGVIITARLNSAYPGVGVGYELEAITSCVLGGVSLIGGEGLPFGVLLGVILVVVIENGLVTMNVSPYLHRIIIGLLLLVAVTADFLKRFRRRT